MAAANPVLRRRLFRGEGMRPYREVTDEEWRLIAPLLPENRPRRDLRGRPLSNSRAVLNGVLWIISTGISWSLLPRTFPPYQTCHRRFKAWHEEGIFEDMLKQLYSEDVEQVYARVLMRMRQPQPAATTDAAATDAAGAPSEGAGPARARPRLPRRPRAPRDPGAPGDPSAPRAPRSRVRRPASE